MTDDTPLLAALEVIRARGAIGERSLPAAIEHADRFVGLVPGGPRSLVDLGSGGGLPALVICWRRPDVRITMVERRATRADLLRRAVVSLRLGERCTVLNADVNEVARTTAEGFDVVTARSFADVHTTVTAIDGLLASGGVALISEPPQDRSAMWGEALLSAPTLGDDGVHQGIRVVSRIVQDCPGFT